jgi:hypothetical protein
MGPVITFMGLARADDVLIEPVGMSGQTPIYQPFFGYGFSLIIEAKPGAASSATTRRRCSAAYPRPTRRF